LGAFLFSGDDVKKKVEVLSGGEKNRVGMVTVLLQNANLLMLDEPTNHLDIPSKEILLKALQEYTGTMLFVSHDRDFINALADHVIELTRDGAYVYEGNYDSFAYQKEAQKSVTANEHKARKTGTGSSQESKPLVGAPEQSPLPKNQFYDLQKKSKRLEESIAKLEKQIHDISMSFGDIEYGTAAFNEANEKLDKARQALRDAELQWELLQRQLEQ
jgi:ATP-binding cassette subfamily F protein 3